MGQPILNRTPSGPRPKPLLTPRQLDVARQIIDGKTHIEAARELCVPVGTVKFHMGAIFERIGVRNRAEFFKWWAERFSFSTSGGAMVAAAVGEVRMGVFE